MLTRSGSLIGTVPYMSPERLRNEPLDGRSDIFAAGVVLFQLVTGDLPFTGNDTVLMHKIIHEPHPRLDRRRQGCPPPWRRLWIGHWPSPSRIAIRRPKKWPPI